MHIPIRSKILKYNISKCEYTIEYNTLHCLVFTKFDPFSGKYPKLLNSLLAVRIPIFLISWGSTWLTRCPINHPVDTYLNWSIRSQIKLSGVWQHTRHPGTSFPTSPTFQKWPIIALLFSVLICPFHGTIKRGDLLVPSWMMCTRVSICENRWDYSEGSTG